MNTTSTTTDAARDAGRITGEKLLALEIKCDAAENELRRMSNLNIGVIEGRFDLTEEKETLRDARHDMLAALAEAGPRLRKQFNADGWEAAYRSDGEIR